MSPFADADRNQQQSEGASQGDSLPKAHNGLLRVAVKMEPLVTKFIREQTSKDTSSDDSDSSVPKMRIILTGHSAGGGVAALLFLHYLRRKKSFKSKGWSTGSTSYFWRNFIDSTCRRHNIVYNVRGTPNHNERRIS